MEKKAINTCEDGTCRTIVAWYAKGGRSNFAAWNGPDRFLMTAVLEEYGYGDETGKISANKFRTNGYNYDFNPTMVNNQGIEFGKPEYFISNKNDYYLKNHEPGKWYVGTQYEDGDEVYPRMVSPNFDTYEEAAQFANDNGLSYDTGLPSEKLKSAYNKAKKEFHDFRTSYYVTHPYDKESNYEYDNQKGWHLKDTK